MRVFTQALTGTGSLTCYVQDLSTELASADVRPAVLVLPGGGYEFCSDREAEPVALAYLAEGFNAFVLRYAVGEDKPWDLSFADGKAAMSWLREHAGEVNIDPHRIAAVGFSAGGHLAASLGTGTGPDDRPDALVLGYPVTLAEFGPPIGKEIMDTVSAVTGDTPATFLFSTAPDALVPIRNSLAFLSALAEHEVPFESHIYLLGQHGLSLAKPLTANGSAGASDEAVAGWLADSVRFLRRVFGDFAVEGDAATFARLIERRRFGLDMSLGRLLADDAATAILVAHLGPAVDAVRSNPLALGFSLRDIARFQPGMLDGEVLDALESDLQDLNA